MDSFGLPVDTRQPLPDGRTWTATCASIDQRHDDAFYVIDFWLDAQCTGCIMVVVHARSSHKQLVATLQQLALSGVANTDYGGHSLWRQKRTRQGLPLPDGRVGMVTRRGENKKN
jgi:hypothetical protein